MKCYICGNEELNKVYDSTFLSEHCVCDECGEYYIEIGFKSRLELVLALKGQDNEKLIKDEMKRLVLKYKKVLFLGNFEMPLLRDLGNDVVHIEIQDILNKLGIVLEDNSRGSDYGD